VPSHLGGRRSVECPGASCSGDISTCRTNLHSASPTWHAVRSRGLDEFAPAREEAYSVGHLTVRAVSDSPGYRHIPFSDPYPSGEDGASCRAAHSWETCALAATVHQSTPVRSWEAPDAQVVAQQFCVTDVSQEAK